MPIINSFLFTRARTPAPHSLALSIYKLCVLKIIFGCFVADIVYQRTQLTPPPLPLSKKKSNAYF